MRRGGAKLHPTNADEVFLVPHPTGESGSPAPSPRTRGMSAPASRSHHEEHTSAPAGTFQTPRRGSFRAWLPVTEPGPQPVRPQPPCALS